ncbi:hypothetical protein [Aliikangiella sp. G2MR2-5]|uniref:hypothetical protein n=1 Tax=Aliikangiella sp. G2MR2-5 TaxID=2788943 RepID=UPI0018AC5001|nr:hypothetical protein [Aliikangiella sp. G2MR2-5]
MKKLALGSVAALTLYSAFVYADQVINDDLIVTFSECVGNDCVNGENFGFDTLRLKENNLRIHFDDTSNSASFPSNDWRIVANDSSNGGASYLAIEDSTAGRIPFRVEAGAPANTLYVEADGDVGIKTANPVVDLHVVEGNTPTLRLEQDGSDGFTAQTWDVAGNEANFFIRDVTNGSRLSFRIRPGAPESSIDIAADGDVGIGTSSPAGKVHVAGSGVILNYTESTDNNAVQIRLKSNSTNRRFLAVDSSNTTKSQILFGDAEIKFAGQTDSSNLFLTANATGLTVNGSISTTASGQVHPDYVFADDYELMSLSDLEAFVNKNSHLPEVPSAKEVAKNGINMTDMQITLLKKVEELTLYTINQQKTIDELQSRLTELDQKNEKSAIAN